MPYGEPGRDFPSHAQALLGSALPRTFIAVGASLTAAFAAVGAGDEVRAAGALRCAQGYLFPADRLGQAAFAGAARPALEAIERAGNGPLPAKAEDAALVERRVAGEVEQLERAFLQAETQLRAAALGTYSWKAATGGAGPESGAASGHLGPFVSGLTRWAFYVEAALEGVRRDDWARVGAALIAARKVTAGL